MNTATFREGLIVAVSLSLLGTLVFYVLNQLVFSDAQFYLTSSLLSLIYLIYLMIRSKVRLGRVTALALWLVITLSSWLTLVPVSIFVLVQLSIVWLLRSLYFYSSILAAVSDLFLTGLSIVAALWAGIHSGTLFLALWSFFLIQSLFIFIPASLSKNTTAENSVESLLDSPLSDISLHSSTTDFEKAHSIAKQALGKLAE